jgi:hypothetical protein
MKPVLLVDPRERNTATLLFGIDLNSDYLPLAQGRMLDEPPALFNEEKPENPLEGLW